MSADFDLIVIGGGSGGIAAARRAASYGARVLLLEASRIGGTCVLRGCVPKKLMMYAASFSRAIAEASGYGWSGVSGRFQMEDWAEAKVRELDRLEQIYQKMLADSGVEVQIGRAQIAGAHSVAVAGRTLSAERILIATGSAPDRMALPGFAHAWTSDDVLDLRSLPSSLLVVGGGYIAVEFASILAGLGVPVTLAFRADLPLRGFDDDLRSSVAEGLKARGVNVAARSQMQSIKRTESGFVLHRANGEPLHAQAALNATGRKPCVESLGLATAGVQLDEKGAIVVDNQSRTTANGIWAIGDVTNRANLTPVAIAEGRAFADTEFGGHPTEVDHRIIASAVFCDPPAACVGLTETQAGAMGPVDIYEARFRPMRTAFIGSQERTCMKMVVDSRTGRVLGVHMVGTDAPEIIQALAVAVTAGIKKADFDRTMALHPTSAEEFVLMREPTRTAGGIASKIQADLKET
ncbi:glutathione-disulfide reductase [Paraburkholderia pallida]|uniref:Glutathione-disulfide reductase n=1 Tax=Paraburkholderia pallida TaxID=2547399 RepID=A0A4P7D0N3_9BURK|nr:glutathione-disulfide reductase [Paraburkholderia pallida]QBR02211.1 glutathione-disulfide reductase [Paraburkholderia pallida]